MKLDDHTTTTTSTNTHNDKDKGKVVKKHEHALRKKKQRFTPAFQRCWYISQYMEQNCQYMEQNCSRCVRLSQTKLEIRHYGSLDEAKEALEKGISPQPDTSASNPSRFWFRRRSSNGNEWEYRCPCRNVSKRCNRKVMELSI